VSNMIPRHRHVKHTQDPKSFQYSVHTPLTIDGAQTNSQILTLKAFSTSTTPGIRVVVSAASSSYPSVAAKASRRVSSTNSTGLPRLLAQTSVSATSQKHFRQRKKRRRNTLLRQISLHQSSNFSIVQVETCNSPIKIKYYCPYNHQLCSLAYAYLSVANSLFKPPHTEQACNSSKKNQKIKKLLIFKHHFSR